jgi:phosphonate transport system substrate-binding protein
MANIKASGILLFSGFIVALAWYVPGTGETLGKGADAAGNGIVHFGVIPRDNPRIAYEKYQPIIDYLSETTPYTFDLVLKKSYAHTVSALGEGDIDIAFLSPLTYLHAYADFRATPVLKSITDKGIPFYRSVIVARLNSTLERLADLEGKEFAFAALQSTSGNLIPRFLLADEGIHISELAGYQHFSYHDTVVKWVLKGRYDAGAVRDSVAERYLPLGLKILSTSEPIPTGPIVSGPAASPEVIEAIRDALMLLNKTEAGQRLLKRLDPEFRGGFVPATDADYDNIRQMVNGVPKGCGLQCHPKIEL